MKFYCSKLPFIQYPNILDSHAVSKNFGKKFMTFIKLLQKETIQQPFLSNGSANKHVSTAMREHGNNGRDFFHAVHAEVI
jgi:hypothetical protein